MRDLQTEPEELTPGQRTKKFTSLLTRELNAPLPTCEST